MSRRERMQTLITAGLVALFALDRLALAPLVERAGRMREETARLEARLRDAQVLVQNAALIEGRWASFRGAGLGDDLSVARLRVQEQLTAWSREAGLSLDMLSTGRVAAGERFDEIGFLVKGTGPMRAVHAFLWSLRHAPFPLRVAVCELVSRSETEDRLGLSLRLSTIVASEAQAPEGARAATPGDAR